MEVDFASSGMLFVTACVALPSVSPLPTVAALYLACRGKNVAACGEIASDRKDGQQERGGRKRLALRQDFLAGHPPHSDCYDRSESYQGQAERR